MGSGKGNGNKCSNFKLKLRHRQGNIVVEEDAEMYAWATAFDQLRLAFCMRGADY